MKRSLFPPALGSLVLFNVLHASGAIPTTLADGLALSVDGRTIEIRVASPHAFRLHVCSPGESAPAATIYLSGQSQPTTPFAQVSEGDAVGIKTSFGELLVDPDKKAWTLRDADGAVLADWAPLGEVKPVTPAKWDDPTTACHLVTGPLPTRTSPLYYGSGNIPTLGALNQTHEEAHVLNGQVGLPQYWSTAGYGALMVGQNENKPASWRESAAGGIEWMVPGSTADLYLVPSHDLYAWLRGDAELTGFAPVPPLWTFGYLQSRWGWKDRADIEETIAHFRADKLPVDAFIFDYEWFVKVTDYFTPITGTPGFEDFGWNDLLFPDPAAQIAAYAQQGIHIVGIRKPRIANQDSVTMARTKGWMLPPWGPKDTYGRIHGRNLNFSYPEARSWWNENNRKFLDAGMAGFWNDEGESAYTEFTYWNLAQADLFKEARPRERFWSLNRSFSPGIQRFGAAVWTGDISPDWPTLDQTTGELLSYSLSGIPYTTCDIGGFRKPTTPQTPELLVRWMEAGVFFPEMRTHSQKGIPPHFPWLSGPEAEAAIRDALDLRYRLLPYYYSLAHENSVTAAPLMRPLVMEFPEDEKVATLTDEWLMGARLLAAPVLQPGGARTVYLPADQWYKFGDSTLIQGPQTVSVTVPLDQIPVYLRAGTLLPLGPVLQYTGQASNAPLELQIYPGRDATFTLVEDDGHTLAYQGGMTRRTDFSWNEQTRTLSWKVGGNYQGPNVFSAMTAVLFSPSGRAEKRGSLGQDGSLSFP